MSLLIPVTAKDIVYTDFDGDEGMLVDLTTKQYYRLNETASLIWRGLERGKDVNEISDEMHSKYEVSREEATASIERLISKLRTSKLVELQNRWR